MFDPATHRDFLGAILNTGVERSKVNIAGARLIMRTCPAGRAAWQHSASVVCAKVGDILVTGETGAQILVAGELVPHFEQSLTQACLLLSGPIHVREHAMHAGKPPAACSACKEPVQHYSSVPVSAWQLQLELCSTRNEASALAARAQVRRVPVQTARMALAELGVAPPRIEEIRSVEASLRLDAVASAGFRMSRAKAADLVKAGDIRWADSLLGSIQNAVVLPPCMRQDMLGQDVYAWAFRVSLHELPELWCGMLPSASERTKDISVDFKAAR